MKAFYSCLNSSQLIVLSVVLLMCGAKIFAQTAGADTVPVVTIQATDPVAIAYQSSNQDPYSPFTPLGKLGVFTVFRHGDTNLTLNVYYQIGGTASNGVDYAQIPNWVTIPAGATSNSISILPLANSPASNVTKTVVLQLAPPPTLNPVNFEIGVPSNAVVSIESTNPPPPNPVAIFSPTNGAVFYAPTNIPISAWVPSALLATNVEFFAGTNDLGKPNGGFGSGVAGYTFFLTWTNPPPGDYALTAVATDYFGTSRTSAPVNIMVQEAPPPANLPPIVEIFSPTNGTVFYAPANISLLAKAADPDGSVTNVEFFTGTTDLGRGLPVVLDPLLGGGVSGLVYFFHWQNVPTNHYSLTAVATDDGGLSTTSAPVNITVLPGPPPNQPPVVRIISPPNGETFWSPVNIPIYAFANDPDGSVASVEFFAGANSLGFGHPVTVVPPPLPPGPIQPPILIVVPTNYWELTWSNAPVGSYALTAKATDNDGASTTSAPVKIAILPSPPPPTNRPPVVSIVASDPVAIEGTNCWVWPGETNAPPTWAAWPTSACRLFTNCGPKTATFTVRRFGDTNGDLTLPYDIGGTASNGVDYVTLPGIVTIPAGERRALITIAPIDDDPPNVNKTVILGLTPSTNSPPDYLLGFPCRAAAIIIDSDGPQPVASLLPDGCFHLVTPGPDAAWFCIQYSTDLANWTTACTNQVINGSINFVDLDAAGNPSRFYRAVPLTNPPSD